MAIDQYRTDDGRIHVRCTSGRDAYISRRPDRTWMVDDEPAVFPELEDALRHARRKTGDLLAFKCVEGHETVVALDDIVGKGSFQCAACKKPYPIRPDDRQ